MKLISCYVSGFGKIHDERFDFNKLSEAELKQFKNLKKMLIFGNDKDAEKLRKICTPLGIEVEPLATMKT